MMCMCCNNSSLKSMITVFLDEGIRVVCGDCIRDKKIEFCENIYNLHDNDKVSIISIGGCCYCQDCFSYEKKNVVKTVANITTNKVIVNKVVSYL